MSEWWIFRSSECWNVFLSVDSFKPTLVSSAKKFSLFKKSPMDESLRWTENLALLEIIGVKVHQGRKKKFDEDIECMLKFQKY